MTGQMRSGVNHVRPYCEIKALYVYNLYVIILSFMLNYSAFGPSFTVSPIWIILLSAIMLFVILPLGVAEIRNGQTLHVGALNIPLLEILWRMLVKCMIWGSYLVSLLSFILENV